jgi:hypothetical protein
MLLAASLASRAAPIRPRARLPRARVVRAASLGRNDASPGAPRPPSSSSSAAARRVAASRRAAWKGFFSLSIDEDDDDGGGGGGGASTTTTTKEKEATTADAEAEEEEDDLEEAPQSSSSSLASPPPSPDDSMSDDEAIAVLEDVMRARMSPAAARVIARGFEDIGVDTPAKLRKLILSRSFGIIALECIALLVNGVAAFGALQCFLLADAGAFCPASNVVATIAAEASFALVFSVFAVESFARFLVLGSFVASAAFFGCVLRALTITHHV